jgi:hypothetical protein
MAISVICLGSNAVTIAQSKDSAFIIDYIPHITLLKTFYIRHYNAEDTSEEVLDILDTEFKI